MHKGELSAMTQYVELCISVRPLTMHETNLLHVISPGHSKISHTYHRGVIKSRQKKLDISDAKGYPCFNLFAFSAGVLQGVQLCHFFSCHVNKVNRTRLLLGFD